MENKLFQTQVGHLVIMVSNWRSFFSVNETIPFSTIFFFKESLLRLISP